MTDCVTSVDERVSERKAIESTCWKSMRVQTDEQTKEQTDKQTDERFSLRSCTLMRLHPHDAIEKRHGQMTVCTHSV